jgi:hypothetical protein
MRLISRGAPLLLLLWTSGSAWATTMLALDVAGLSRTSDSVVVGTVARVSSRWTGDHARIVTEIELTVAEAWKGQAPQRLVLTQPGGEVGDIGQRVDGAASFVVGEEVVLFLETRGSEFTVTGMAQGRFKIDRTKDGKSASVRQDQCSGLFLLDSATRKPVSRSALAMPIEELKRQIVAGSSSPAKVITPAVTP